MQVYQVGAYPPPPSPPPPPPSAVITPVYTAFSDPMTSATTAVAGQYASFSVSNWTIVNSGSQLTSLLCFKQTYSTSSSCSTLDGFSISLAVSLGPIPTLDSSIADAFVISFLSPSSLAPTACTPPAWQSSNGVQMPKLAGFHLAVDLYNNWDGVGFKAFSSTTTGVTQLAANLAIGSAGVSLLTAFAVKNAFVTHTIDVYGGYVTWRIGGAIVLTGASASAIPSQFFLAFMANTGGSVSSQYVKGPLTFGCTAFLDTFLDTDGYIMRWQRLMILFTLVLFTLLTSIWFYCASFNAASTRTR